MLARHRALRDSTTMLGFSGLVHRRRAAAQFLRELLRLPMSVVCSNVSSRGTARLLRPGGPPAWRTDIDTHKTTRGGLPRRDSWYSRKCPPHKVGLLACTVCARYLGLRAPLSARVWVDCSASPTRSAPVGHGRLSPGPWAPSRSGPGLRLGVARAGAGPGRCPVGHPAVARRACLGVLAYA